jgi:hypothetical protein
MHKIGDLEESKIIGYPYHSQPVPKHNSYISISRKRATSEVAVYIPVLDSASPLEEDDSLTDEIINVHSNMLLMQSNKQLSEKLDEAEIKIKQLEDENANLCNTIEVLNN